MLFAIPNTASEGIGVQIGRDRSRCAEIYAEFAKGGEGELAWIANGEQFNREAQIGIGRNARGSARRSIGQRAGDGEFQHFAQSASRQGQIPTSDHLADAQDE